LDHQLPLETLRTAIALASCRPTSATRRLPRVMLV
jgi:hypothetical protein